MNLRIGSHVSDQKERLSAFAWIMVVMCAVLVSAVQLGTMVSLLAGRVGFSSIFPVSIGVAWWSDLSCCIKQDSSNQAYGLPAACFV
jgi:hypothetical protein